MKKEETIMSVFSPIPTTLTNNTLSYIIIISVIDKANEKVDTIMSVFLPIPTTTKKNTLTYINILSLFIGMYLFISNKKKTLKSNIQYI